MSAQKDIGIPRAAEHIGCGKPALIQEGTNRWWCPVHGDLTHDEVRDIGPR